MTKNESLIFEEIKDQINILRYVAFMSLTDNKNGLQRFSDEKIEDLYLKQLGKLTTYYNYNLLGMKIKLSDITCNEMMHGTPKNTYHAIKFLDYKLKKLREKKKQESISLVGQIIELLERHRPTHEDFLIYVDANLLFSDIESESPKAKQIIQLSNRLQQKVSLLFPINTDFENLKLELTSIISCYIKEMDHKTIYVPMNSLQIRFETLIMSDLFRYKQHIKEIIESFELFDPQEFINQIFKLIPSILNDIEFNSDDSIRVMSYLLYRYIFDEVYFKNKYIQKIEPLNPKLQNLTCSFLQIPKDISPPFNDDDTVVKIFRYDSLYKEAVAKFEEILFQTNPLDIISTVHQTVLVINKCASHYCNGTKSIFSFEETFTIFIAIVIASSAVDMTHISSFVDMYTPAVGLSPSFDYARAKIIACTTQLNEFCKL